MLKPNCKTCVFWDYQAGLWPRDGADMGQCRINAPVSLVVNDKLVTRWPLTAETDYCGQHATYEET